MLFQSIQDGRERPLKTHFIPNQLTHLLFLCFQRLNDNQETLQLSHSGREVAAISMLLWLNA